MTEHTVWARSIQTAWFSCFCFGFGDRCNCYILETNLKAIMTVEVSPAIACLHAFPGIPYIPSNGRHRGSRVTRMETLVTLFSYLAIFRGSAVPRWSLGRRFFRLDGLGREAYFPKIVAILRHLAVRILRASFPRTAHWRYRSLSFLPEADSIKFVAVFFGDAVCIRATARTCSVGNGRLE